MAENSTILVGNNEVIITSPIYNKVNLLNKIPVTENTILVINGNITYPYDNIKEIEDRISLLENKIYIVGSKDLEFIKDNWSQEFIHNWVISQKKYISFKFKNESLITVMNGGISKKHSKFEDLDDIEVPFINNWHDSYDGRFGFIVSSKPNINNELTNFNLSCSFDNTTDNLSYLHFLSDGSYKYYTVVN